MDSLGPGSCRPQGARRQRYGHRPGRRFVGFSLVGWPTERDACSGPTALLLLRGSFPGADDGIRTRDPHLGNHMAIVSCDSPSLGSAHELHVLGALVSFVSPDRGSRLDFVGDFVGVDTVMRVTQALRRSHPEAMAKLRDYRFGHVIVEGREVTRDVIVLPHRVVSNWWRRDGHSLVLEDLEDVLDELPERLIVGTGATAQMRPDPSTLDRLRERGVQVECLPTEGAVVRFGELDPARTAAALHLTC